MLVISEPSYAQTDWHKNTFSHLKVQARKKRVPLAVATCAEEAAGEGFAFVLGGSAAWISQTVAALQSSGCHPIVLTELPEGGIFGRYSCVKTDYARYLHLLYNRFTRENYRRVAFYGVNHASLSDLARKELFLDRFPMGEIFSNDGSLALCYEHFAKSHEQDPFDAVVCANDLAAVSLLHHMGERAQEIGCITVNAATPILSYFPSVFAVGVDHAALAVAAFEIAACIEANPGFIGMRVTVDYCTTEEKETTFVPTRQSISTANRIYADGELDELLRIGRLLSECDETDRKILRLIAQNTWEIGEETYLSDNGVKYRVKKMKRICDVPSKSDIPRLLGKYGICLE